jgi:hypothetical protein
VRKTLVALIVCTVAVSAFAATGVASASQSPLRDFPVAGAKDAIVTVNMETGTLRCVACGLQSGGTYYLQLHTVGRTGAAVIGSSVADQWGQVVITGKLGTSELQQLNQNSADFIIGQHVV